VNSRELAKGQLIDNICFIIIDARFLIVFLLILLLIIAFNIPPQVFPRSFQRFAFTEQRRLACRF